MAEDLIYMKFIELSEKTRQQALTTMVSLLAIPVMTVGMYFMMFLIVSIIPPSPLRDYLFEFFIYGTFIGLGIFTIQCYRLNWRVINATRASGNLIEHSKLIELGEFHKKMLAISLIFAPFAVFYGFFFYFSTLTEMLPIFPPIVILFEPWYENTKLLLDFLFFSYIFIIGIVWGAKNTKKWEGATTLFQENCHPLVAQIAGEGLKRIKISNGYAIAIVSIALYFPFNDIMSLLEPIIPYLLLYSFHSVMFIANLAVLALLVVFTIVALISLPQGTIRMSNAFKWYAKETFKGESPMPQTSQQAQQALAQQPQAGLAFSVKDRNVPENAGTPATPVMKTCKECLSLIPEEDSLYCPKCGAKQDN